MTANCLEHILKRTAFFDKDGNIAEFIERPTLDYPTTNQFSIENVIKLNEIGLPVQEPIKTAHRIIEALTIQPIDIIAFKENFCWVGDFNGVVIVVKAGRHWLPTKIPSIINDFSLQFLDDKGNERQVKFENNVMKVGAF